MDLRDMAREQRRRLTLDALEFEREREAALRVALEQTAADLEGESIDQAVFADMTPEDVEIVRKAVEGEDFDLSEGLDGELDEEWLSFESDEERRAEHEQEAARLETELADSRRRQAALERYLELL